MKIASHSASGAVVSGKVFRLARLALSWPFGLSPWAGLVGEIFPHDASALRKPFSCPSLRRHFLT